MDGDFELDVNGIQRAVMDAEVLSVLFVVMRKVLLVDTRFSPEDPPLVCVVSQVGSLDDRYRSIRRMRPQFPRPRKLVVIPWSRYVSGFVDSGAVTWIRYRLEQSGYTEPLRALNRAVQDLRRMEQMEFAAAIRGERYHTIWSGRK